MTKSPRDVSPVSAKLTANIDAKIPGKSSGKLVEATARLVNAGAGAVEAITDIVRPLTEWAGLRGDRLRLQREEVALEIAKQAAAKVEASKKPLTPIPTKTIVRLLEGGSLEEPTDKTMIDLWANLLASAAQNSNASTPRFISILEDLNGAQAQTLRDAILGKHQLKRNAKEAGVVFAPPISERELIHSATIISADICQHRIQMHMSSIEDKDPLDEVLEITIKTLTRPGIAFETFSIGSGTTSSWRKRLDEHIDRDYKISERDTNNEILTSIGLLTKEKAGPFHVRNSKFPFDMTFTYFRITPLCISFISAVSPDLVAWDAETAEQAMARRRSEEEAEGRVRPAKAGGRKPSRRLPADPSE